jgi:DNA-binding CsgD family transcriptional regulator
MEISSANSSTNKLTDIILGKNTKSMVDALKDIASEIGVLNISFVRFASNRSWDVSILTSISTHSKIWQARYFLKRYALIDPIIRRGSAAILPFDWDTLPTDNPETVKFFADARRHGVGRNGLSIPVRNRKNTHSVVSFSNDAARDEWENFKSANMTFLQQLCALIDSAASIEADLPKNPVQLSLREEQCLVWAGRGKTYQEVADILGLSVGSVKTHLDTARHKLHCINLTHAVGVAVATGVIPPEALRDSP